MSEDWVYTIFDEWWRPSDALEDGLSVIEGDASRLFRKIESFGPASDADWTALLWFIALTACRHPKTMGRGHTMSKEVGVFLMDIQQHSDAENFAASFKSRFGSRPSDDMYAILSKLPHEMLKGTILHLIDLHAYDPALPRRTHCSPRTRLPTQ